MYEMVTHDITCNKGKKQTMDFFPSCGKKLSNSLQKNHLGLSVNLASKH